MEFLFVFLSNCSFTLHLKILTIIHPSYL